MKELRREAADLVVTNEALFGVMAGCESLGQRFATFSPNQPVAAARRAETPMESRKRKVGRERIEHSTRGF